MNFVKVVAFPIWPDKIRFQWQVDLQGLSGQYVFQIFYSGSPEGEWEPLSLPLVNQYTYLHDRMELLSSEIRNKLYFKITCTPPKENKRRQWIKFEKLFTLYHGLNKKELLKANEIIRKENLRFEHFVGVPLYILKEKTFGEKCTECIDEHTGTIIDPNCTSCFGTEYVGGYHTPVKVWGEIVDQPVSKQASPLANTTEDKTATIRLTNEVLVDKHDIIVDVNNNNRWLIMNQPNVTSYRTFPINQQVGAVMKKPKDIIYKFPLEEIE